MKTLQRGPRRALWMGMIDYCIRLSETEEAFIYSLCRDGVLLETEKVPAPGVAEPDAACEYYGGSLAMD